jgi:hypothetical protein
MSPLAPENKNIKRSSIMDENSRKFASFHFSKESIWESFIMDEKSQKVLPNFPPKGIENLRSG